MVQVIITREGVHVAALTGHFNKINKEHAVHASFGGARAYHVVYHGSGHHQDHKRKANPEQADESKKLPPKQYFPGYFEVIF